MVLNLIYVRIRPYSITTFVLEKTSVKINIKILITIIAWFDGGSAV